MDLPFNRILFKVEGEMASHVNSAAKHSVGARPCFLSASQMSVWAVCCCLCSIILVISFFSQHYHLE